MFCSVRRILTRKASKYANSRCRAFTSTYTARTFGSKESHSQEEANQNGRIGATFGQPTPETHPHLLREGELLPGIRLEEFRKRRRLLMESLVTLTNEPERDQIAIVPSGTKVYMSDKIPYVFRQNTDFLYLTGCQEHDSILVITARRGNFTSTLFVRPKDEQSELWDGPRTGVDAAPGLFGVERALPVNEFERFFLSLLNESKKCVVWYDDENVVQPELHMKMRGLIANTEDQRFVSPTGPIHRIRAIKTPVEIELMKKSCEIASAAIAETIRASKPGISEHRLFAIVDYECRINGAEFLAYPPVVAGGKNANIIHYIANNQIIHDGDMVLMDAGCEYHGYSSDITRTWPVNGTFTPQQRVLYEVVLDVQNTLIGKLKDMPSLDRLFHDMCLLLGMRLQEIGLIPKDLSRESLLSAAFSYCPHHVSHYLGMDVHDTTKVPRSGKVQPGMIVTVEPGIYVNPKNQFALPEFSGLGIRVEDDVLITESGPVVLTESCPKGIAEIEALAKENL